jgi:hypothetical protein
MSKLSLMLRLPPAQAAFAAEDPQAPDPRYVFVLRDNKANRETRSIVS